MAAEDPPAPTATATDGPASTDGELAEPPEAAEAERPRLTPEQRAARRARRAKRAKRRKRKAVEPAVIVDRVTVSFDVYQRTPTAGLLGELGLRRRIRRRVTAVDNLSFTVGQGERVGFIGTNGAGKTTTLSAIAGLVPVSHGVILTSARPVFLGVGSALTPRLTGRENIRIGLISLGLDRHTANDIIPEIAEFTGLGDRIDLPVRTYSSGMRARLQFSIAIATDPKILIVDETLAVGDAKFRRRSTRAINQKLATSSTLFFVSHNANHVARICDRLIWLDGGAMVMDGPTDDVLPRYEEAINEDEAEDEDEALTGDDEDETDTDYLDGDEDDDTETDTDGDDDTDLDPDADADDTTRGDGAGRTRAP